MSHNPAADVAAHLASAGRGTLGRDIFEGKLRAVANYIPAKAIFVEARPGRQPDRVFGKTQEIRYPQVQIMVRSTGQSTGREVAFACYNDLESNEPAGYIDSFNLQSEPLFLEQDENGYYLHSINLEVWYNST